MIVRHGRVHNPGNVVYARLPGFRLSDEGRRSAERAAGALAAVDVRAVFSSPLERAVETAEILAAPHGLPVTTDERLIEWGFWSRWEGIPWDELPRADPEALRAYSEDPEGACPEDPLAEVAERVLGWAAGSERPDGVTLGVSHETPVAAALLTAEGEGVAKLSTVRLGHLTAVRLRPAPAELLGPLA